MEINSFSDRARPKRGHRWYQFRLRTLLIAVALLAMPCAYVAHEAKVAALRRTVADSPGVYWSCYTGPFVKGRVSLVRRLFGDEWIDEILVSPAAAEQNLDWYKSIFPEATVTRFRDGNALTLR